MATLTMATLTMALLALLQALRMEEDEYIYIYI